jgi:uncharacterized protein YjbJ (UPF0337 family)
LDAFPARHDACSSPSHVDDERRRWIMNWDQIEGNWKKLQGRARERWGDITDDDLQRVKGKKDQLIGKLQEKRGMARDEAEREVESWANSL